ncbi:serine/threonine protein kinase [Chitinispirillum alkaliphilum]|nr:serine/threonine protein kinase [Chitinispirillum alkaliphilum]
MFLFRNSGKNRQSLDSIVSKIGYVIPKKLRVDSYILPNETGSIKRRHKILKKVFQQHKPPIFIGRHMGSGGFAEVYSATSDYDGVQDFAIKILREDLLQIRKGKQYNPTEEEMRVKEVKKRFKNESYVQWDLSKNVSDNIANSVVPVYDHGEFDSKHEFRFILMERMDMTLRNYIKDSHESPDTPRCKIQLMIKIAEKLSNVHKEGIFHRDIKPENILFSKGKSPRSVCRDCDGKSCGLDVRIGDFGTVRWMKSYTDKYDAVIIGSQFYMSPEQILNPKNMDKRTDIYSFGIICYELLHRVHPKNLDEHSSNFLEKLAYEKPRERTPPQGYELLQKIINKCMNERWSRYQNMEELLCDLRGFLKEKISEDREISGSKV